MRSKAYGELSDFQKSFLEAMSEAEVHRLQAHPAFDRLARESNRNATLLRQADPILFDASRQVGRFLAACAVLSLAASPGGLTYQRLGGMMTAASLSGFGRVQALILYLRTIGYIEPLPTGNDGREKRYGPTPAMKATFRRRFHQELQLAREMEPVCGVVADRFEEPELFDAFTVALGEGSLGGITLPLPGPTLAVFSDRTGGMTIMAHMIASADAGGAVFPTVGPAPISVSALAKAANVSRRQVRLVQAAAEEAGFLLRVGGGPWIVSLALAHQARFFFAARVLSIAAFARQALRTADAAPGTILA
ncbi:MAG: hypothetical protein Q7T61_05805 [Caulobacter sp.]|nr:hypothetical protein [Caulobacter sp.]